MNCCLHRRGHYCFIKSLNYCEKRKNCMHEFSGCELGFHQSIRFHCLNESPPVTSCIQQFLRRYCCYRKASSHCVVFTMSYRRPHQLCCAPHLLPTSVFSDRRLCICDKHWSEVVSEQNVPSSDIDATFKVAL